MVPVAASSYENCLKCPKSSSIFILDALKILNEAVAVNLDSTSVLTSSPVVHLNRASSDPYTNGYGSPPTLKQF